MLDYIDTDYIRICAESPTSTSALTKGSEPFRTVMDSIIKENYKTEDGKRDTKSNAKPTTSNLCRLCENPTCRCKSSGRVNSRTYHRVQWADEFSDGQLTREHRVDFDSPISCAPPSDVTNSIKSILKCRQDRANCVIIIAE